VAKYRVAECSRMLIEKLQLLQNKDTTVTKSEI